MRCVVTGGSGFIGSRLVESLLNKGHKVTAIDKLDFSADLPSSHKISFEFARIDVLENRPELSKIISDSDVVFHLAANSSIKLGSNNRDLDISQNVIATKNILESMIPEKAAKRIAFTSSSSVYGQASLLPTPETFAPLKPLSLYAASKMACEAFISAYCNMFKLSALIFRLSNITGPNDTHGIIYDFNRQVQADPSSITILSDGKPKKSYLHVDDCVRALMLGLSLPNKGIDIVNVGNTDQIDVYSIAKIFKQVRNLVDTSIKIMGGNPGDGGGWTGDVTDSFMTIDKIETLGWKPTLNSEETIKKTAANI